MKLDQIVTSLELSKRLKELGVKQESLFYYQNNPYNDGQDCIDLMIREVRSKNNENVIMNTECDNDENIKYPAYTASELLELLPKKIDIEAISYYLTIIPTSALKEWMVFYRNTFLSYKKCSSTDENICDALAKMLINLIEQGIIKP